MIYYKVFEGLGIIYLVTRWVILFIVNSKSFHQSKQKPTIWSDIFCWKFEVLELLFRYIHNSSLVRFSAPFWWISSINLSLELHVVSTFWLESDTSGTFSLYYEQSSLKLERSVSKMQIFWCRTNSCNWKLSTNVS